jgi:hypothetical protein
MTIAICLKVGDGVVLGTDSATSLIGENNEYYNIYLSGEKTINVVKGLPIGLMTYGLGALMGLSIGSLARDLRNRLTVPDPILYPDWALDVDNYTMEEVADRVKLFFYDEMYVQEYGTPTHPPGESHTGAGWDQHPQEPPVEARIPTFPVMGFVVAGFSANDYYPEVWTITIDEAGYCTGPTLLYSREDSGVIDFWGQPEALHRLVNGWSSEAHQRLVDAGLAPDVADQLLVSHTELAHPGMPMQDAIDLVRYLADVTVGFVRFKPGIPTVAPPIDIAAITRHQGFRWVSRKHYYPANLNPSAEDG